MSLMSAVYFHASVFSHEHQRNGGGYDISFPKSLEDLGEQPARADIGIRGGRLIVLVGLPLAHNPPAGTRWVGRVRWYRTPAGHRKIYIGTHLCKRGCFSLQPGKQAMEYAEHRNKQGRPYWVIQCPVKLKKP